MARSAKTDPIRNFKFQVEISPNGNLASYAGDDIQKLGFAVVSGLSVNNEMVGYREGGMNTHPHKFVGQSDFAPVTFSRGVFAGQAQLYKWQQFIHSWNQATGASTNVNNDYRCDIIVKVFDHPQSDAMYAKPNTTGDGVAPTIGEPRMGFKLFECWPGAYSLSDLNAGDSGIMIQQMTIHHEGFVVAWNPTDVDGLNTITG
jgi:phage tail-like protein